ncbi:acetyltransferase (GNAT) family protein [Pseudomonas duriflava]|uniref:Acetyltransferase (GNAT) family protein n=1 Tax=Pseudomonas duriflava TaxID=459528 RepID=A0A562QE02_9PSED|nr:GNAT family N-acetyltransferase [Pseudomonas duriflava]TWI54982.1 acetyltransferase (GNAT) family protein [Pseudomonas duriflava]
MGLVFKPPAHGDYKTLATWVSDAEACVRWAGPQLLYPFSIDELPALLKVPGESFCLTDDEDRLLAFGQYRRVPPHTIHLCRIIVAPEMRRQGLARQLCQRLIQRGVQMTGASKVTLRVYRDNVAAQAVYRQLGFVPVALPGEEQVIGMRLRLEQPLQPPSQGLDQTPG